MKYWILVAHLLVAGWASAGTCPVGPTRNVLLFVPDGLRHDIVTAVNAPTMFRLMRQGVEFTNSHALFPTFTTANASAMATGHYLGDTGDFSNVLYIEPALDNAKGSVTPFLENDTILRDLNERLGGNYLNEDTVLALAQRAGFSTAAIGKLGPTLIVANATGSQASVVIDDRTGFADGVPLSDAVVAAMTEAGLPKQAPTRGANGALGKNKTPETRFPNLNQQAYFATAATQVVLPMFKDAGCHFLLVFWSRDPDGTQHNQSDSLGRLWPGINGPTALAAVRNADDSLAAILSALQSLGLDGETNVIVSADHGFSTISKISGTSAAARNAYSDVPSGSLPPGFLALDLADALGLSLFDPDDNGKAVAPGQHSVRGNGLLGADPQHAQVVVAANGGSDLIYLLGDAQEALAKKTIDALLAEDYVSGIFLDDKLPALAGTLPLSAIRLSGHALTSRPSIVVNFASRAVKNRQCPTPLTCVAEIADTTLQQGQGMHGSFSRADTYNFMAAFGPDFKTRFKDFAPVSNADVGQTIAELLQLDQQPKGMARGRVLREALKGGTQPRVERHVLASQPSESGLRTVLRYQQIGAVCYFDAGGFPGRTVGLGKLPARVLTETTCLDPSLR